MPKHEYLVNITYRIQVDAENAKAAITEAQQTFEEDYQNHQPLISVHLHSSPTSEAEDYITVYTDGYYDSRHLTISRSTLWEHVENMSELVGDISKAAAVWVGFTEDSVKPFRVFCVSYDPADAQPLD